MEHYDWNEGWLFAPTFDPALVRPECPELSLTPVRLPHTVKPLPYNYCSENDYQRLCGYRREFFAPKEWLGRTVLLTFGAVAHDATVFCNGRRVFHHGCGYTAFTVDLTGALQLGQKNVVAVRCDSREDLNIPPFGGQLDALTYGGIYRAVSLDIKEPAYLRDVFIEAKAEGDFRIYTATVGETIGCTLQAEIRSPAGSRAVYSGELSLPITGTLNNVHPWSLEHPTLYTLTMRLIRPGTGGLPDRVLDEKTVRFGFRGIAVVHDVCYRARPDFYTDPRGRLSAAWHCLQYRRIAKRAERIITVSEFSKSEIAKYYGVPASKMDVVYNAWQQMQRIAPDESIFARHPQLKPGQYYFSMANLLKNKNFPWVLRAAGAKPDAVFAIAGGGSLAAEAERLGLADLPNVLYLGYVSDGAAKALMAHCKAFLFPTLYEGFGIPPLEAAACGAPQIIVSDTPCMREVYGPCAAYIDLTTNPGDVDDVTPATAPTAALLEKYSWDKSAERLLQILEK